MTDFFAYISCEGLFIAIYIGRVIDGWILACGVSISVPAHRIAATTVGYPFLVGHELSRIGVRHHVHEMPLPFARAEPRRYDVPRHGWAIVCIGRFPRVVALNQLVPLNVISLRTPFQ